MAALLSTVQWQVSDGVSERRRSFLRRLRLCTNRAQRLAESVERPGGAGAQTRKGRRSSNALQIILLEIDNAHFLSGMECGGHIFHQPMERANGWQWLIQSFDLPACHRARKEFIISLILFINDSYPDRQSIMHAVVELHPRIEPSAVRPAGSSCYRARSSTSMMRVRPFA
jgi:hypothetical protein